MKVTAYYRNLQVFTNILSTLNETVIHDINDYQVDKQAQSDSLTETA